MRTSLDWSSSEVAGGILTVPFAEPADPVWLTVAADAVQLWEGETKGQTWGRTTVDQEGFRVADVRDAEVRTLQGYLVDLLAAINRAAGVEEGMRAREDAAFEAATVADEQQDAALEERFRRPPR